MHTRDIQLKSEAIAVTVTVLGLLTLLSPAAALAPCASTTQGVTVAPPVHPQLIPCAADEETIRRLELQGKQEEPNGLGDCPGTSSCNVGAPK